MRKPIRFSLILGMSIFLATATFADLRFGAETTIGLVSQKLFFTEQSRYLDEFTRTVSSWRLSGYVGWDTGSDTSKFAFGFEQHAGIQVASLSSMDHLPLIFSLPSRVYVRFGSNKLALDILAGIDNQIVVLGSGKYPAYTAYNLWTLSTANYEAAPSGYAMGMEVGLRFVIRHFYLTGIVALPVSSTYMYPGMIRVGLGVTF